MNILNKILDLIFPETSDSLEKPITKVQDPFPKPSSKIREKKRILPKQQSVNKVSPYDTYQQN